MRTATGPVRWLQRLVSLISVYLRNHGFYLGLPLDLFQRLFIAPASFTVLALGPAGSYLVTLNYDLSFTFSKP
jgi:hypothetical protein